MIKLGFGGSAPSLPPAPPPPPKRDDPDVTAAREKARLAELRRKGRRASVLTSGSGVDDDSLGGGSISRPTARSAKLLGE